MADERDEPRIRVGVAQLLGAGGGRLSPSAIVLGLAGVAAFSASLMVDWVRVSVTPMRDYGIQGGEYSVGLSISNYAVVYPIGVLGLLTLVGVALPRPELARRLRVAAVALGGGLAGVLVAISNDFRDVMWESIGYPMFFMGPLPSALEEVVNGQTYATLPGQLFAFAAVALLVVAVWLAGGSALARTVDGTAIVASPDRPVADDPAVAPVSPADAPAGDLAAPTGSPGQTLERSSRPAGPSRVGSVDGLTVVATDVIDLGGHDVLRD